MSQFYASIQGQAKTEATRTGTASSGISGHVRGWDLGVHTFGYTVADGKELYAVEVTHGSNGRGSNVPIGHAELRPDGTKIFKFNQAIAERIRNGADEVTI